MKIFLLKSFGVGFIFLLISIFYSCKKEKYIIIEGRLLISNTNPIPVTNYELHFFQPGSPGIPIAIYSLSSEGFATTDNSGNYSAKFKLGRSGFMGFEGSNTSPIDMRGEATGNIPGFYITNIPADGGTVYLYKKIDNAFLILSAVSAGILPNDTLTIQYNSTNGYVEKIKTGITVPAGTNLFTIDTITNLALSHYDFMRKKYQNTVAIKLKRAGLPYSQYINSASIDSIGPGDEQNKQLTYYLWQ
jgi:hypothetical protein